MRTLEPLELKAVAGGELDYVDDYDCDSNYSDYAGDIGDIGEPSPSYVDAKSAAPDNPSESVKPSSDNNGNTTVTSVCTSVSAGVISQQTCLNSDNTTTVQTCVNVGAGVSGNYCSTTTSQTKK